MLTRQQGCLISSDRDFQGDFTVLIGITWENI